MNFRKLLALSLALLAMLSLAGCGELIADVIEIAAPLIYDDDFVDVAVVHIPDSGDTYTASPQTDAPPDENGSYYSKEDVALYLQTYKKLPPNYITKAEARKLGWEGGTPERFRPGAAIGGDVFGNYEGLLPEPQDYRECDIDTLGADSRGAKRIVYAEDFSAIWYTGDHYESFELLYAEGGK